MEPIIERIKDYVIVINPTINDDDYLDFVVRDVVDRFLVYTNRAQLVAQYEEDLLDESVDESDYVLPLPKELERTLASTIVGVYRTVKTQTTEEIGAVKSIKDNGQEITYSEKLTSYLSSSGDSEVFSSALTLMNRYIIANVITDGYPTIDDECYWR